MDDAVEIGPANDEQCARLRRALRAVKGFQLVFIEVEDGVVRGEVLRRLNGWVARGEVGALAVVAYDDRASIEDVLKGHSGGVVLTDLDAYVAPNGSLDAALRWLNWERDRLPAILSGPLALVVGRDGLQRVLEIAPDLASWRRYTARFDDTHVRDLWTLHEAAPWHTLLAAERERIPVSMWPRVLGLHERVARVLVTGVVSAIRARGSLGYAEEAETLYEAALAYPWVDDERAEVEAAGGQVALDRNDGATAAERCAEAQRLIAPTLGFDARARFAVLMLEGRRALLGGNTASGLAAYAGATDIASARLDQAGRVSGLVGTALANRLVGDHVRAAVDLAAATEIARVTGTDWLEYHVALARGWVGDGRRALDDLAEAYRLAAHAGSPEAVEVAVRASSVAASLRDASATTAWHRRAAPARSPYAPTWMQQSSWRIDAWLAAQRNDYTRASASYQRARDIDPKSASSPNDLAIGRAELLIGSIATAAAAFTRARADAIVRHDQRLQALAEIGLGQTALAQGANLEPAAAMLRHAIDVLDRDGARVAGAEARGVLGNVFERMGRIDDAIAERERVADVLNAIGL